MAASDLRHTDLQTRCRECGGRVVLDPRHDELACASCGLVEESPAWARAADAPPVQAPTLAIPRRALPAASGRRGPTRGVLRARHLLNRLADELRLPSYVAQDAFARVRRLHRDGGTRGRRLEAVAAAALLDAARDRGLPRTAREVAEAAGLAPADVGRAQRALASALGSRVLPSTPARFLPAVASRADLAPLVVPEAARLLQTEAGRRAANGRRPQPVAAAALLLAARRCETRHSLARIAEAAGVSRQAVYDAISAFDEPARAQSPGVKPYQ